MDVLAAYNDNSDTGLLLDSGDDDLYALLFRD